MNTTHNAYCCVCNQAVDRWLPHPLLEQRGPLMVMLGTVGSDLAHYQCPHCGCNDRDRHLWLYLHAAGVVQKLGGARVLHLAPERTIEPLIEVCGPAQYVRGDLYPTRAHHQKMDAQALPFEDGLFDLVIANHLLEHVQQPDVVLSEFHRVLRPGGAVVAQTPYSPLLVRTLELNGSVTPDMAKLLFGQEDHVRLFGADIGSYFKAAGFGGDLLSHDDVLPDHDALVYGCNVNEPFFGFCKATQTCDQAVAA